MTPEAYEQLHRDRLALWEIQSGVYGLQLQILKPNQIPDLPLFRQFRERFLQDPEFARFHPQVLEPYPLQLSYECMQQLDAKILQQYPKLVSLTESVRFLLLKSSAQKQEHQEFQALMLLIQQQREVSREPHQPLGLQELYQILEDERQEIYNQLLAVVVQMDFLQRVWQILQAKHQQP